MSRHRGRSTPFVWIKRYLVPEFVGTGASLLGAWSGYATTGSLVVAAIVGTLAETIGFYGVIAARTALGHARSGRVRASSPRSRGGVVALLTVRSIVAEFVPAEVVDTLAVRPLLLYAVPAATGSGLSGWLLGKLAADLVFYTIAVTSFEAGRRLILPHSLSTRKAHSS
ncbi:hypothetical protein E6C70_07255 [Glaciibacter flavus]|uniref:Uncharacterized protein n=1 Tax=Orlajensenia flava TaxID=2565934 RepID=A0A4S4G0C0_9MICO|nr:hypothetical protein [Glaciibacter flavus]THG35815.1 hypothetical protein E6C70_07255 [Glaciibacter flavus]